MIAPLVFADTETTGLRRDDEIWEFAGIRRDPDGVVDDLHLFIEHDPDKCNRLPERFRVDHDMRYDDAKAVAPAEAAKMIAAFLAPDRKHGRVHIVGAVPNFDTERLSLLLEAHGLEWPAHYHLIDVENLAVGYLAAVALDPDSVPDEVGAVDPVDELLAPPWISDDLSKALGITPDETARHTAMGDTLWAMAIYDKVMGGLR